MGTLDNPLKGIYRGIQCTSFPHSLLPTLSKVEPRILLPRQVHSPCTRRVSGVGFGVWGLGFIGFRVRGLRFRA